MVHADEEKKFMLTGQVKEWYNKNCLFLPPGLRKDFRSVIFDVDMYKDLLADYKATGGEKGFDAEETKKKRKELDKTFKSIRYGMQKKIQDHIDIYYDYIK